MSESKCKCPITYTWPHFSVGIGVAIAAYAKMGLLDAIFRGMFWEVWGGYRLAKYLLG